MHLSGYTGPGMTWANEMNTVINHAPGAGSIAPVDQQFGVLPLYSLSQYLDVTIEMHLINKAHITALISKE